MQKVTVRVGGVPEPFNVLWHHAIEHGYFTQAGIDLIWIDYPSGSSPLAIDMDSKKIDLAVILTESIIKSILEGKNAKIVNLYVESKLNWGIYTGYNSQVKDIHTLTDKKIAVSRLGSGSRFIAEVFARKHNLPLTEDQFVEVHNLPGAILALSGGEADFFFWESLTTKPYVDDQTFRLLGTIASPWEPFVLAGSTSFLEENKGVVYDVISIIQQTANKFMKLENKASIIAEQYHHKPSDVRNWLETIKWTTCASGIHPVFLQKIVDQMIDLRIIPTGTKADEMLFRF